MRFPIAVVLLAALAAPAQQNHRVDPITGLPIQEEDVRLPSGKLQREEILKAEYEKSLVEARELSKLADELNWIWRRTIAMFYPSPR